MSVMNYLTRYALLVPIPHEAGFTVAEIFVDEDFTLFGVPEK